MVSSGRHPKKEIADALDGAETSGFTIQEVHNGHLWGHLICNTCGRPNGKLAINCSPKSNGTAAKRIAQFRRKHDHSNGGGS